MRFSFLLAILLAATAAALSPGAAGAQGGTTTTAPVWAVTLLGPVAPATVSVGPAGAGGRSGTLAVTVESNLAGTLTGQFVVTSTGATSAIGALAPAGAPTVGAAPGDLRIGLDKVHVLHLTFTLRPGEPVEDLTGTLVVAEPQAAVATLAVQGPPDDTPLLAPQPGKVTVAATSWLPIYRAWLFGASSRIELPPKPEEPCPDCWPGPPKPEKSKPSKSTGGRPPPPPACCWRA